MKSGFFLSVILLASYCPAVSKAAEREPVGLRLSGHAKKYGKTFQFEIVMEGFDRYYRKEWSGDQKERETPGFVTVEVIVGEFAFTMGRSWSDRGERGGGSGQDGKYAGAVARRLWDGERFTGVSSSSLRAEVEHGHFIEQFCKPISRDKFPAPCVVEWTDPHSGMLEKTTTYTVEKAEFIYESNAKFFDAAKADLLRELRKYEKPKTPQ